MSSLNNLRQYKSIINTPRLLFILVPVQAFDGIAVFFFSTE